MTKLIIVMLETFKKHCLSKAFLFMITIPVLVGIIGLLATNVNTKKTVKLDVVTTDNQIGHQLITSYPDLYNSTIQNYEVAQKRMIDTENSGFVQVEVLEGRTLKGDFYGATDDQSMASQIKMSLKNTQVILNYKNANLSDPQFQVITTVPQFENKTKQSTVNYEASLIALGLVFIIYLICLTYSTIVAQEIGSEKGNKVMEMILSVVSAKHYFYGKVLGMMLLLLVNIIFYVTCIFVLFLFKNQIPTVNLLFEQLQTILQSDILATLIIDSLTLILGTTLFLIISTFGGIAVTKQEDITKSTAIVSILIMILFFASIALLGSGDFASFGIIGPVLAVLPISSTFFLPIWFAFEVVPLWVTSLALILDI